MAAVVAFCLWISGVLDFESSKPEPEGIGSDAITVGQCVDIDQDDVGQITLSAASCEVPHDAQVVYETQVGTALGAGAEPADLADAEQLCTDQMPADDLAELDQHDGVLDWALLIDDPSNLDESDRLVCYVADPDGRLAASLLTTG